MAKGKLDKAASITFTPEDSKQLANKLAEHITTTGFNALSKNDFYDYILYLLDTYSNEHFLSLQSNSTFLPGRKDESGTWH